MRAEKEGDGEGERSEWKGAEGGGLGRRLRIAEGEGGNAKRGYGRSERARRKS